MHRLRLILVILALTCAALCGTGIAQPASWSLGPPAAWVRELPLPERLPTLDAPADLGRRYLIVDHQVRVDTTTVEYHRLAWTPLNTAGVQKAPEIQIHFDPTYERLRIHHVRVIRSGVDVFRFRVADVHVVQKEASLDERLYTGDLTAVIFLRDLRPGDTVDYAYSLEGANPILEGGYDDELTLAYDAPVTRIRHIVSMPAGRNLYSTPRSTTLAPRIETSNGWRSYTWEAHDAEPLEVEEHEPGWYDPDPRIEVSTFASWSAVADWARSIFERELRDAPETARLVDEFKTRPGGQSAQALATIRFVQDEVRYLGIEMGPHSHQPHPPDQVLRQRFGDCKDKSLLLVALLRGLGIDASAAMTDIDRGRGLDDVQPSPFAFNHAIVHAVIAGRTLWIDATESGVGGTLDTWEPPPFERALVLKPGTTSLATIPLPDVREPLIDIEEIYTLGSAGQPTRLEVRTAYRGSEANSVRETLATTTPAELAKSYLEDYAKDDPQVRAAKPPFHRDDRDRNIVEAIESYDLPGFWKDGKHTLDGWQIRAHFPTFDSSARRSPAAMTHPVHVRQRIVVRATRAFHLSARTTKATANAFAFNATLESRGTEMRLTYDYSSLADAVAANDLEAHRTSLERAKSATTFVLTETLRSADAADEPWWNSAATFGAGGLAGLAISAAVARVLTQRRSHRQPRADGDETKQP
jgi:hypothetical protein